MPHSLINHNFDLKMLFDEGHVMEIKSGYLLIHDVPYVNSEGKIKNGTLVTTLNLSGEIINKPDTHVIHFIGEFPCDKNGIRINGIEHSFAQVLGNGIRIDFSFSNKPREGYANYYDKITQYIRIISAPAKSLNKSVTEKTHRVVESNMKDDVFNYPDTNSIAAEIDSLSMKLMKQKIAIIGLGGTGSYILDLIAKTPVQEIHLYDGDIFLQKNAFRAPGAPSIEKLRERLKKVDYWKEIYSKMHRNIHSHGEYISDSNIEELVQMNFIFLCLDSAEYKRKLINLCEKNNMSFVDVGMGIQKTDDMLSGILRVTASTNGKRDHVPSRITLSNGPENEYIKNIQIADLNALNASLAVIKWKKLIGFYADFENEHNISYVINTNTLWNEDHSS